MGSLEWIRRPTRTSRECFPSCYRPRTESRASLIPKYNCIAWAAGDSGRWWEPDEEANDYWPPGAPRNYSIDAYIQAFESIGFERCGSSEPEPGLEKVAVFADATGPTHAAKQLVNGKWSSKLGALEDIEHVLEALTGDNGDEYGQVVRILKRRIGRFDKADSLAIPRVDEAELERMTDDGG
jgi:hypothetical protein